VTTEMDRLRKRINVGLSVGLVLGGGAICAGLIWTKPAAPTRAHTNRIPEVSTIPVVARLAQSPIIGHGTVRPKKQIDIVPQVNGKLLRVHSDLATGKIIPQGDLLFEIDATMYETRARQVEAEIRGLEGELGRHDQELANIEDRIANARKMLEIEERDLETSRRLYEAENVGTSRDVDLAMQKYLHQKDAVTELENRKAMIPHLRLQTQAQLDASRARLEQAKQDLANTKIFCPFKARVEVVQANESQVVNAFFSIARLTDMEAFEISVGIDPRELHWLDESVQPGALEAGDDRPRPHVVVHWGMRGQEYTWLGDVTRFERVDEATRTARMVVEVRDVDMRATVSDGDGEIGAALSIGMFCRTELPARPLPEALLVPRHAVYDNRWVYVFEPDTTAPGARFGSLARRRVPMLRAIGDDVLVDYVGRTGTEVCELQPGEQVVTSLLLKPVVGMRVRMRDERIAATTPGATATTDAGRIPPGSRRTMVAKGSASVPGDG